MAKILHHLGCMKPKKNGKNYQPKLVSRISAINRSEVVSSNIDTKNDDFFNVSPFKYGYFGYPTVSFRGCA